MLTIVFAFVFETPSDERKTSAVDVTHKLEKVTTSDFDNLFRQIIRCSCKLKKSYGYQRQKS